MKITIERTGLETLLHTMLSCRCPVSEETERELLKYYFLQDGEETVDFNAVLTVADENPVPTPVHFLRDFCVYLQDDLSAFTITHNDVLRYFCTSYHLNRMRSIDPTVVRYPATFLISHLLVPTRILENAAEPVAEFTVCGNTHRAHSIFISPELTINPETQYGLHMGVVVTELTTQQAEMMSAHLEFSKEIQFLSKYVGDVDFSDFEHYGDYRGNVVTRYQRHFAL